MLPAEGLPKHFVESHKLPIHNRLSLPLRLISQEARGLLTRLDRVQSFVLFETMVPAAAPSLAAQAAIEKYLEHKRRDLRAKVYEFLEWLHSDQGQSVSPREAQRRYSILRLGFNAILTQFDIFADVMTQRSENNTGVWLAGLDLIAEDAIRVDLPGYTSPPMVCYLDRGHGAAIRRARTRLPGGGENPVGVIRIPRERMIGAASIGSSLVHEVGHQGSANLDIVESLRPTLQQMQYTSAAQGPLWVLWERWISEILSDFWAVSKVGIAAPLGLLGVVSLPRAFVFRMNLDDPHPIPWIRVKLSCAMGGALYVHPQWQQLAATWEILYPLEGLPPAKAAALRQIEASIPAFIRLLLAHSPSALGGHSLGEVFRLPDRTPERLRSAYIAWRRHSEMMIQASPTTILAAFGQARADGLLSPEEETRMVSRLLTEWARRSAISVTAQCAPREPLPQFTPIR
jgi:hypothetical protein